MNAKRHILSGITVLALLFGAIPAFAQEQETTTKSKYTFDMQWSERSNFKLFGSTATPKPILGTSVNADLGAWEVFYLHVEGLGTHPTGVGAIADYHDLLLGRSQEWGKTTLYIGTEVFYSQSQLGGGQLIFVAPLATLSTDWTDHVSTLIGAQGGDAINSVYNGAKGFVWAEVTCKYTWGRVTPKVTIGGAGDNLKRTSLYMIPGIELALGKFTLSASGLRERNWNAKGGQRDVTFTPTLGVSYDF